MYLRAFIVVLAILNLGVGWWWLLGPPAAAEQLPHLSNEAAGLELVAASGADSGRGQASQDVPPVAAIQPPDPPPKPQSPSKPEASPLPAAATSVGASATADAVSKPATTPVSVATPETSVTAAEHCLRLGPFAGRSQAEAGLAAGRSQASQALLREISDTKVPIYRVMLPSVGDRAAAETLSRGIAEKGLGDYYLITRGQDIDIALGRYRSREGAERRRDELVAAGFAAQLVTETAPSQWWIDVKAGKSALELQRAFLAAQQRPLDCATLR